MDVQAVSPAAVSIGSQGAGADLDAEVNAEVNEPLWQLLAERSVFTLTGS